MLVGDVREELRHVESGSVRCCVTSPPYEAQKIVDRLTPLIPTDE